MTRRVAVEQVDPRRITKGDVIKDPAADRWLTVGEVTMISAAKTGAYSFYGSGPDDRVTFEGHELVTRRVDD
jgi:hypothetical protein